MKRERVTLICVVMVVGLSVLFGDLISRVIAEALSILKTERASLGGRWLVAVLLVAYVALMAVPFVPGAEIGLMLMMVLGAEGAPVVYGATVTALVLAYWIGRLIPETVLENLFERIGCRRTSVLLRECRVADARDRAMLLADRLPFHWMGWLARRPVVTLAVLINLPGSTLLGGGGGIAMVAGVSRMVIFPQFIACVLVAVAPVPLLFWLMG